MGRFVFVLLVVGVCSVWGAPEGDHVSPVEQCPGENFENLKESVIVSPCGKTKCKLHKGTDATITIRFKPSIYGECGWERWKGKTKTHVHGSDRGRSEERSGQEYPKPTSMYEKVVEEAKEVYQDRSKWKDVVSAYPYVKEA